MWTEEMGLAEMNQQWKQAVRPPKKSAHEEESHVLQVQMLLCLLLLGALLLMQRAMPTQYARVTEEIKKLFESGMETEEELVRFAMTRFEEMTDMAFASVEWTFPYALSSVNRKKAPDGSSLETYLPESALGKPVKGYYLTSGYGWRSDPFSGKNTFHTGIDLAAEQGTAVYPALSGYVRLADYNSSYGNHLRILHKDGTETLYAHLQYLFVSQGETVQQTTLLGTVGKTGNTTGPHLHFELLHDDIRYDPSEALKL